MAEKHTRPAHHPGTRKGEEMHRGAGKEPGRHETGTAGAGRGTGKSTARDFTGINPEHRNPIDPASPTLVTA
jgi:hypothetical protein